MTAGLLASKEQPAHTLPPCLRRCSNKFTKCRKEQTDFEEACPVS